MNRNNWLATAIGALFLGFGFAAVPAQAAPAGVAGQLGQAARVTEAGGLVDQVRRRCYWRHGRWHCGRRPHLYFHGPGFNLHLGQRRGWHGNRHWRRDHHGRRHGRRHDRRH